MGMFDDLLGQFGNLDDLAQKLGLPAEAVQALTAKLQEGGNPIAAMTELAAQYGVSPDMIQKLTAQFGGADSPLGGLGGLGDLAKDIFGGKS